MIGPFNKGTRSHTINSLRCNDTVHNFKFPDVANGKNGTFLAHVSVSCYGQILVVLSLVSTFESSKALGFVRYLNNF